MEKFDKCFSKLLNLLDSIAQMILFCLMMFFIVYIVLRWFGINIMGTFEIAQYSCLMVVVFAIPKNSYKGGNITITVLTDALPEMARKIIITFADVLTFATVCAMEYGVIRYCITKYTTNAITANLRMPTWIFVLALAICLLIFLFVMVCNLVYLWTDYTNVLVREDNEQGVDAAPM